MKNSLELLDIIAQEIFDKKGANIIGLDLRKISTITDYVIIAEGNVERHATAIAESVIQALKDLGIAPTRVEGLSSGDWVVIDYMQIMVHIFIPTVREKYQLETLWREGSIVDLAIQVSKEV